MRVRLTAAALLLCALLLAGCSGRDRALDIGVVGEAAQTVPPGMGDLPAEYGYGAGNEGGQECSLPVPTNGETVLAAVPDPTGIQSLYLWEEGDFPTQTELTPEFHGEFDPWDFRPYVTVIPVREGVEPKGAVVLMAGGGFEKRCDYSEALPSADALRERGYITYIVDYRIAPYTQEEGALDVARTVRYARRSAPAYGYDQDAICVLGFSAGGIQAGEFLLHYDEDVLPTAIDPDYVPDELDALPARATASAMIYGFYGRRHEPNSDVNWLAEGDLPPLFYAYGTQDAYLPQFEEQCTAIEGLGIPLERVVLEDRPHGFGAMGGWVKPLDLWLKEIWNERGIPMPGMESPIP